MDRGRCGLDLESNRFLREQKLTRKRNDHMDRLKKIKTRKPGSSTTLDNTAPECMFCDRFKSDPRKVSKKKELNNTIERENKVLLQRISHILTAPPKITDSSYIAMKKLLSTLGDTNSFNLALKKKYNKQFFERVNKTTPFYNHKKWEKEYETQLRGQKFMRQVNYQRPQGWVDPFQGTPPAEDYDQARSRRRHEREAARSVGGSDHPDAFARSTGDLADVDKDKGRGGHVNKVKKLRASKSNPNPKKKESFAKEKEVKVTAAFDKEKDGSGGSGSGDSPPFSSRLLARVEKSVLLHTPCSMRSLPQEQAGTVGASASGGSDDAAGWGGRDSEQASVVQACVLCSLVENAYIYLTLDGVEMQMHAEALVHVSALFLSESESAEGKVQMNFPLDNEGAQDMLAIDIAENVSLLKTAKGDFQVVLPWSNPLSGANATAQRQRRISSPTASVSASGAATGGGRMDMSSVMSAMDDVDQGESHPVVDSTQAASDSSPEDRHQEPLDDYFTPLSVSCGVRTVLSCGVEPDDLHSRMKLRRKKEELGIQDFSPEDVFLLVKVTRVGEERARVVVHAIRDSVNLFRKVPALPANTRLELMIALPSVLTVESELMEDYFKNAATNIRVEHSQEDGVNSLIFE